MKKRFILDKNGDVKFIPFKVIWHTLLYYCPCNEVYTVDDEMYHQLEKHLIDGKIICVHCKNLMPIPLTDYIACNCYSKYMIISPYMLIDIGKAEDFYKGR